VDGSNRPDRDPIIAASSREPDEKAGCESDSPLRTISSAELLHGAREVLIRHEEKLYRLRVTRNGKLILIK
jgi:hemin uptake protein HemP